MTYTKISELPPQSNPIKFFVCPHPHCRKIYENDTQLTVVYCPHHFVQMVACFSEEKALHVLSGRELL